MLHNYTQSATAVLITKLSYYFLWNGCTSTSRLFNIYNLPTLFALSYPSLSKSNATSSTSVRWFLVHSQQRSQFCAGVTASAAAVVATAVAALRKKYAVPAGKCRSVLAIVGMVNSITCWVWRLFCATGTGRKSICSVHDQPQQLLPQ